MWMIAAVLWLIGASLAAIASPFSSPMMMSTAVSGNNVPNISKLQVAAAGTAYSTSAINENTIQKNQMATSGNTQYLCYYNTASPPAPKFLTRDLTTNVITFVNPTGLAALGNDDDHRNCSITVDTNGFIHIIYGLHGGAMNYYRSNAANNVSAFTAQTMSVASGMAVTYPFFIKNPATGALYLTFRNSPSPPGSSQVFFSYNTGTTTWSAAAGTGSGGIIINDNGAPTGSPYLNGIPKWDASGHLWFNWELLSDASGLAKNQYLMMWNGASFVDAFGTALTMPVVSASFSPIVTIAESTLMVVQNDFTINNGVIYIPYARRDGSGVDQIWVAESSDNASFVEHQLTSFTTPLPATCGGGTGSAGTFPLGPCQYYAAAVADVSGKVFVVYQNLLNPTLGVTAVSSTNSFLSFAYAILFPNYSPNFELNADPGRATTTSFMLMDVNDYQYGVSYSFPNAGSMSILDWAISYSPGTPAPLSSGGGGIAADVGCPFGGTIPPAASAAGFTHLALNANFLDASGQTCNGGVVWKTPSTWLSSCGASSPTYRFFLPYGFGPSGSPAHPDAPCNHANIITDGSNGQALDILYSIADQTSYDNDANGPSSSGRTTGLAWPGEWNSGSTPPFSPLYYWEIVFRITQASLVVNPNWVNGTFSAIGTIPIEFWQPGWGDSSSVAPNQFESRTTCTVPCTTMITGIGMDGTGGPGTGQCGTVGAQDICNSPGTYTWDQPQTWAFLITGDGTSKIGQCGYRNNVLQSCGFAAVTAGDPFWSRMSQVLMAWNGDADCYWDHVVGHNPPPGCLVNDTHIIYQAWRVWVCPNYKTQQCTGTVFSQDKPKTQFAGLDLWDTIFPKAHADGFDGHQNGRWVCPNGSVDGWIWAPCMPNEFKGVKWWEACISGRTDCVWSDNAFIGKDGALGKAHRGPGYCYTEQPDTCGEGDWVRHHKPRQ